MSNNDLFSSTIYCIESKIESPRNLYGRFVIEPLAIGQGITVGNTLRRILLGDIEGAAITSVKIPGANNEFSILPGIRESVLEILLNLKEIVFRTKSLDVQKGYLSIQGPCVVKAANLQLPTSIEVVDGGQYIATLSGNANLDMEFVINTGKGYQMADYGIKKNSYISSLPVDAIFMPIHKVNYMVEQDHTSKFLTERVILEIWTNGSISPRDALDIGIKKVIDLFNPLHHCSSEYSTNKNDFSTESKINDILVEELELSVRAYNCLKRAQIHTISDLLAYSQEDLLEIKNFGRRSAEEVIEALEKKLNIYLPKEKY